MKLTKDSLKTGGWWVGAASGSAVPAVNFFTSLPPPLFPMISLITAALSGAIILIVSLWKPKSKSKTIGMRNVVLVATSLLFVAVVFLVAYVLLLQFTTVVGPDRNETRFQIGFGTESWSLTEQGRQWKDTTPTITPKQMLLNEAAFDQDRVIILWTASSVYGAGVSLIVLYFLAFVCWTTGFAALARFRPRKIRN